MKTNNILKYEKRKHKIQTYYLLVLWLMVFIAQTGCKKIVNADSVSDDNLLPGASSTITTSPNILIILADDVGYEVPTCDGGESYSTPALDWMAQNGKRFTQCHSAPRCSPSRFMLLTGKYNFRNYTEWGVMPLDQHTIGNMFQDAGYATCYTGKWQLDGGDNSIHSFGWENYSVWLPFVLTTESLEGSRYKSAKIYQDGGYLPPAASYNKYSDDIFTTYLLNFIDSAKKAGKPFFAYYSMILNHFPYAPTPDDQEYTTWTYDTTTSDKKFFPSMVKYSDKKIGEILTHLGASKLLDNTIVIYTGDNGTGPSIKSNFDGFSVKGGKESATELGTNVPLIVVGKGRIGGGTVSDVLVDFTDFLPTLKEVAGITTHLNYGRLDGISFAPALVSNKDSIRPFIYDAWLDSTGQTSFFRWVQTAQYKLYDTIEGSSQSNTFVKIEKAKPDSNPIPDSLLTPDEEKLKLKMQKVLNYYQKQ